MNAFEEIFRNSVPDEKRLKEYGFAPSAEGWELKKEILDGQFELLVSVTGGAVRTALTDTATNEPYTLYLVEDAQGAFVGEVRLAVTDELHKIAARCFEAHTHGATARELIEHVKNTYGDEPEYLWEDENAVWRRKDNRKWYGALLSAPAKYFGLESDGKAEVLDFRMEPEKLDEAADGKKIFRGYHMNKKHWATVVLDGSVPKEEIFALLAESYRLAKK